MSKETSVRCDRCGRIEPLRPSGSEPVGWSRISLQNFPRAYDDGRFVATGGDLDLCPRCGLAISSELFLSEIRKVALKKEK